MALFCSEYEVIAPKNANGESALAFTMDIPKEKAKKKNIELTPPKGYRFIIPELSEQITNTFKVEKKFITDTTVYCVANSLLPFTKKSSRDFAYPKHNVEICVDAHKGTKIFASVSSHAAFNVEIGSYEDFCNAFLVNGAALYFDGNMGEDNSLREYLRGVIADGCERTLSYALRGAPTPDEISERFDEKAQDMIRSVSAGLADCGLYLTAFTFEIEDIFGDGYERYQEQRKTVARIAMDHEILSKAKENSDIAKAIRNSEENNKAKKVRR